MDQLYMLEILVHNIQFPPKLPVVKRETIVFHVRCANFINTEIMTKSLDKSKQAKKVAPQKMVVDIECGKSYVFAMEAAKLKNALKNAPLKMVVYNQVDDRNIGVVDIFWNADFIYMVESSEDAFGYVSPVEMRETITLDTNVQVDMYYRLTFLGKTIDTHIQVIDKAPDEPKQYLFKSNNAATAFQCEKIGTSEIDVVAAPPIFSQEEKERKAKAQKSSIQSLMGSQSMASAFSVAPSVFKQPQNMINPLYGATITHDSFSSLKSANLQQPDRRFFDIKEVGSLGSSFDSEPVYLTAKMIEKKLCKHPDCLAAKLFAAYGIGPLAKKDVHQLQKPIACGLSHLNGRISNYGPLGTFRAPKNPNLPFKKQTMGEKLSCGCKKSI